MSQTPPNNNNKRRGDSASFYFEQRKSDHIRLSLNPEMQSECSSGFENIDLIHEALPELQFSEIQIHQTQFGIPFKTPFLISAMTAGHAAGLDLNLRLARAASERGWLMGVGSQRKQLFDTEAKKEWKVLRQSCPDVKLLGNIGLSQLIRSTPQDIQGLVETLQAVAMVVHTNPLQEVIQKEGTPDFKGGLAALKKLTEILTVPVILKETGCGFSKRTMNRLRDIGLSVLDVSGNGGTHWGRIEGGRAEENSIQQQLSFTYRNWGISTVESLLTAQELKLPFQIWASGGIRSGLDAAKAIALGAQMVGLAQPALKAALAGEEDLHRWMVQMEMELKVALFCTGSGQLKDLNQGEVWKWRKI